jgi:hypothetical protein
MGRLEQVNMDTDGDTTDEITVAYKYDHNGFRIERTEDDQTNPPVTTIYHVDPSNATGYAQVLEEGADGDTDHELDASEVQKTYTLGLQVLTQATEGSPGVPGTLGIGAISS